MRLPRGTRALCCFKFLLPGLQLASHCCVAPAKLNKGAKKQGWCWELRQNLHTAQPHGADRLKVSDFYMQKPQSRAQRPDAWWLPGSQTPPWGLPPACPAVCGAPARTEEGERGQQPRGRLPLRASVGRVSPCVSQAQGTGRGRISGKQHIFLCASLPHKAYPEFPSHWAPPVFIWAAPGPPQAPRPSDFLPTSWWQ